MLLGNTGNQSKGLGGLDLTTMAELPAGRLAHDEHTRGHDGRSDKANAHGDAPGGGRLDRLGAEVDTVGDEDTESNEELVGRDQGATNLARSRLGLVHGGQHGQGADAEAVDQTADDDLVPLVLGGDADDVADNVDDVPESDAVLATEPVRDGGRDQRADQATNAEHSDHQTLAYVAELEATIGLLVTEAFPEVVHLGVTRDGTTLPAEDETTERDKKTHDYDTKVEDLRRGVIAGMTLLSHAVGWRRGATGGFCGSHVDIRPCSTRIMADLSYAGISDRKIKSVGDVSVNQRGTGVADICLYVRWKPGANNTRTGAPRRGFHVLLFIRNVQVARSDYQASIVASVGYNVRATPDLRIFFLSYSMGHYLSPDWRLHLGSTPKLGCVSRPGLSLWGDGHCMGE